MSVYATASDVQNLTNLSFTGISNPSETQVQGYIAAAQAWIDAYSGHNWFSNTVTQELYDSSSHGPRRGIILLRSPGPVLSIVEVDYYNGNGNWVTCNQGYSDQYQSTPTYLQVLPEGKIMFTELQLEGLQILRVTYTYGYASVPTYVNELCALLAAIRTLQYLSGSTMQNVSMGDLKIEYPPEGQYGAQLRMFQLRAAELKWQITSRKLMAATG